MNNALKKIEKYCLTNSTKPPDYLDKLHRETNIKTINPRMLSGTLQGRILSMICHLINPEKILEIGTFTAYASLCLAEGLSSNGKLDTIEVNRELEPIIHKYIEQSPFKNKIIVHYGNALEIIDTLDEDYGLIFLDAKKEDYISYYEKIIPKLIPGGVLIADNVLWSGKVILEDNDFATEAIKKFNDHVMLDSRTENIIVPVRDGLSLIRKKRE